MSQIFPLTGCNCGSSACSSSSSTTPAPAPAPVVTTVCCVTPGAVDPTTPPDDPTTISWTINITDGGIFYWDVTNQVWTEINPQAALGIHVKDTVDDLRLVDESATLRLAVVFGNLVAGDGQGRSYRWNPDETEPDDGISIIRPASQLAGALGAWNEL